MMGLLHQQLKEATAPIHRRLDAQSVLSSLIAADLQFETYQQIMVQHWLAYQSWQRQLDNAFCGAQLHSSWRIDLAVEQLALDCGMLCQFTMSPVPPEPLPLRVDGPAHYLGCAYVFAGSRMGGRYILRALQAKRDTWNIDHFYYYEKLARHTKDTWPTWMQRLEAHADARNLKFDPIIEGAIECFETLADWFKRPVTATLHMPNEQPEGRRTRTNSKTL